MEKYIHADARGAMFNDVIEVNASIELLRKAFNFMPFLRPKMTSNGFYFQAGKGVAHAQPVSAKKCRIVVSASNGRCFGAINKIIAKAEKKQAKLG